MLTLHELATLVQRYRLLAVKHGSWRDHEEAERLAGIIDRECALVLAEEPKAAPRGRMQTGPSKLLTPNPNVRLYEAEHAFD